MSKVLSGLLALLLFVLLLFALQPQVLASDALLRLPENALGFVIVQDMTATSGKIENLLAPFGLMPTSPLAFAKSITGLNLGLDFEGDLVIALLPGGGVNPEIEPMVLLPVSSYQEFAVSTNADTSGEICRITLLGEDVLVAQDGPYALLMNVEHRATMEELVTFAAEPVAALAPLAGWLPSKDLAFVLMPSGIDQISQLPQQQSVQSRRRLGYQPSTVQSLLVRLYSLLSSPQTRSWLRNNINIAAVGLAVDDQSNVRLTEQFILSSSSALVGKNPQATDLQAAKLGLSDAPSVFTAGGPVAPGWGKHLADLLLQFEQKQASARRLKELLPELKDAKGKAYRLLLEEIRSCSVMMLSGKKGDPLIGNFLGVATVPDSTKYLAPLPKVVEIWNKLAERSAGSFKPTYELLEYQVGDKQGYEIAIDIATTARDPRVPIFNWMLESALGPEGIIRIQLVPLDAQTVAFGIATPEQMTKLLAAAKKKRITQPQTPESLTTFQLLQPNAPWKLLVSPQGCLRWIVRANNEYRIHLTNQTMALPEIASSSPIGLSIRLDARRWEGEIVCPASTWQTVGKYLETLND